MLTGHVLAQSFVLPNAMDVAQVAIQLAKTGAPGCGWPAYTREGDQLMEFSADSGVRTGFKKAPFTAVETFGLPPLKLTR